MSPETPSPQLSIYSLSMPGLVCADAAAAENASAARVAMKTPDLFILFAPHPSLVCSTTMLIVSLARPNLHNCKRAKTDLCGKADRSWHRIMSADSDQRWCAIYGADPRTSEDPSRL